MDKDVAQKHLLNGEVLDFGFMAAGGDGTIYSDCTSEDCDSCADIYETFDEFWNIWGSLIEERGQVVQSTKEIKDG